jgi:G3E family GTPase
MKRIPVTIVSGFCSSGKSSLIAHLQAGLTGSAVTVIQDDGERDLLNDLHDLAKDRSCEFAIIEGSAAAMPFETAEFLVNGDEYGLPPSEFCRVDCLVTVVDASTFLADVNDKSSILTRGLSIEDGDDRSVSEVILEQIEFADVLVLNKIDLVEIEQCQLLTALLERLNPRAFLFSTARGRVQVRDVIDTGYFDFEDTEYGAGWLAELEGVFAENVEIDQDWCGVSSFTFDERRPFHPTRFQNLLDDLQSGELPSLLGLVRAKGAVWIASRHHEIGIWSVAGNASALYFGGIWFASTPVSEWPKDESDRDEIMSEWELPFGDRRQHIAFIGVEMNETYLRERLNDCLLRDDEMVDGPLSWDALEDPLPSWYRSDDEEFYRDDEL